MTADHGDGWARYADQLATERDEAVARAGRYLLIITAAVKTIADLRRARVTPSFIYAATVERVVDGDTLDVDLDLGMRVHLRARLRLEGVDTPERGQPGYGEALRYVQGLVTFAPSVVVATRKPDKYGRALARVALPDGRDLSDLLIAEGHGVAYDGGAR